MKRNQSGGTLALVAVCAFVIVLIGVAVFFLSKMFGGGNELRHATDSGNLNVAKTAIRHPELQIASLSTVQKNNFGLLGDTTAPLIPGAPINLLTYNRAVGQTLLVALNARDEGTGAASTNADTLKDALQNGATSLGGRLKDELIAGTNILTKFDDSAQQNNTRMFGNLEGSGVTHVAGNYRTAYVDRDLPNGTSGEAGNASQATNVVIAQSISNIPNFIPAEMISTKTLKAGGTANFVRGYHDATGIGVVGVPVYPDDQPHHLTDREFHASTTSPVPAAISVPPNAFQSAANATEQKSQKVAVATASAKVGSLSLTFPLNFENGYIVAINGPYNHTSPGPFVGDSVIENQLGRNAPILTTGTGPNDIFSNDASPSDMDALAKRHYRQTHPQSPSDPGAAPALPGGQFFDSSGNSITPSQAENRIQYTPSNGPMSAVTAQNVVACNDTAATTGGPPCQTQYNDGAPNAPFVRAFPNSTPASGNGSPEMAVECVSCVLEGKFNGSNASISLAETESCNGPGSGEASGTGFRIFPHSEVDLPSPSPGVCTIPNNGAAHSGPETSPASHVHNGTISQLFEQTEAGSWNKVFNGSGSTPVSQSLLNRIRQMNPSKTADVDPVATKTFIGDGPYGFPGGGLPINQVAYIYFQNGALKFDAGPPPGKVGTVEPDGNTAVTGTTPDGNAYPQVFQQTYGIVEGIPGGPDVVNVHHDRGIHDIMYQSGPTSGNITATDFASWRPHTGLDNVLGRILFRQTATGSVSGFDDPD